MKSSESLEVSARGGGYGGGGGGGGYGGGHGGGYGGNSYVDPYVVLASLGFGVFLFNIIYNLLNRSTRSIDVDDIDIPLHLSDMPQIIDLVTSDSTQSKWDHLASANDLPVLSEVPHSSAVMERVVQSFQKGFQILQSIRTRPECSKPLICKLWNDPQVWNRQPYIVVRAMQLYVVSLAQYYGASGIAEYADLVEKTGSLECPVLEQCQDFDLN